jgi:predicted MFS family arabinose efflux permease
MPAGMGHHVSVQSESLVLAPRGRLTWVLFGVGGCFAYLLNGIGSILTPLQRELGVSRGEVALLPELFAIGLVIVGLVGGPAVRRLGRQTSIRGAMVGVAAGAVLVAGPGWPLALLGAAILGGSCAVLVQLLPVLVGALHPRRTTAIIAELNSVSSFASVVAPLAVGAALALGFGWRPGYLWPAVLMACLLPLVRGVPAAPADGHAPVLEVGRQPIDRAFWSRWLDVLIAVSAEFCVLFWIASAFTTWYSVGTDAAVLWASTFMMGMALGRAMGTPVTQRIADRSRIVTLGCAVALAGFAIFWGADSLPVSAFGAVILGLGIALLYPVTIAALMRARPDDPDGASARGTLASGLAIGCAPFLLATTSDQVGLHAAYLIVPILLGALLIRSVRRQMPDRRTPATSPPAGSTG